MFHSGMSVLSQLPSHSFLSVLVETTFALAVVLVLLVLPFVLQFRLKFINVAFSQSRWSKNALDDFDDDESFTESLINYVKEQLFQLQSLSNPLKSFIEPAETISTTSEISCFADEPKKKTNFQWPISSTSSDSSYYEKYRQNILDKHLKYKYNNTNTSKVLFDVKVLYSLKSELPRKNVLKNPEELIKTSNRESRLKYLFALDHILINKNRCNKVTEICKEFHRISTETEIYEWRRPDPELNLKTHPYLRQRYSNSMIKQSQGSSSVTCRLSSDSEIWVKFRAVEQGSKIHRISKYEDDSILKLRRVTGGKKNINHNSMHSIFSNKQNLLEIGRNYSRKSKQKRQIGYYDHNVHKLWHEGSKNIMENKANTMPLGRKYSTTSIVRRRVTWSN